jgi:hypothetical protein
MGGGRLEVLIQIGPCRRDKRATSIGKDKGQIQVALPVAPTEKLQGLPLQRVMITQDSDFGRETLDVGSMS